MTASPLAAGLRTAALGSPALPAPTPAFQVQIPAFLTLTLFINKKLQQIFFFLFFFWGKKGYYEGGKNYIFL